MEVNMRVWEWKLVWYAHGACIYIVRVVVIQSRALWLHNKLDNGFFYKHVGFIHSIRVTYNCPMPACNDSPVWRTSQGLKFGKFSKI